MQWFLKLMEELKIDCQLGHPAKIRKAEIRQQKHDRRDARLLLKLLVENRFPSIWMPSTQPFPHDRWSKSKRHHHHPSISLSHAHPVQCSTPPSPQPGIQDP
jgi:hypothetical protein